MSEIKNFEFTPIGYVKSKQGVNDPAETAMSPTTAGGQRSPRHVNKAARRSIDDTVNSSRIADENDTFDDTLPELEVRKISQYQRRNFPQKNSPRVRDENRNDERAEVSDILAKTSNPIKDQEKKIKDLEHENTVLKVKNVSYRSLLANYSNTPGSQNNLNLIEEVSIWKTKYLETNEKLIKVKRDYEEYINRIEASKEADNNTNLNNGQIDQANVLPIDNPEYIKERETILEELEKVTNDFKDLRKRYSDIEKRYMSLQDELKHERDDKRYMEDQYNVQMDDLKNELGDKLKSIQEQEKKISSLESQLESVGTQSGSETQGLIQELKQKDNNISELQNTIEEKTKNIRNIKNELSEKELLLKETEEKYKSVQDEYNSYKQQTKSKLSNSEHDQTTSTRQLEELKFIRSRLEKENKELKDQITTLEKDLKKSENRNTEMKEDLQRAQEQNKSLEKQYSEKINLLATKLSSTESDLNESNKLVDNLKKDLTEAKSELDDAAKTIKELHHEIIQNATRSKDQINAKLLERNSEIASLKQEIETLDAKLFETKSELDRINSTSEEDHKLEIRRLKNNFEMEKESIEREVKILSTERERLEDIHKMEIESLERKYDILKRENDRILNQEKNENRSMDQYIKEKNDHIKELNENIRTLLNEKTDFQTQLESFKESKEHYKNDLKDALSTIDRLKVELTSIKEMKFSGDSNVEKKYNKLKEEFKLMKKGYLDEMIKLQNRNRELSTEIQKRMEGSLPSSAQGLVRDKLDYYKLKYNNEVRQNNDLKVINEYLNRVLRASAQDIRLNLLKVENDLNIDIQRDRNGLASNPLAGKRPYSSSDDYRGAQYRRYSFKKLRFKTVALAVLSVIRMHRTGRKHNWDEQRIRYLQRKIITEEDRITW
ncbi:Uncharacterized protein RNJ44_02880 [Nakaseomyces bracarensis]|uniref:Spindle pole body component 110 n=1 Tax=Nakaseomyces bracarensis TaxID=273131 RepID=A0ABR4P0I1_9SACH